MGPAGSGQIASTTKSTVDAVLRCCKQFLRRIPTLLRLTSRWTGTADAVGVAEEELTHDWPCWKRSWAT